MKKKFIMCLILVCALYGCGQEDAILDVDAILDDFIANKIPATVKETGDTFYINDFLDPEYDIAVGDRLDLDNDGENELIITDYCGGTYYDVKDGQVWLFAQGEGTAEMINHIEYDGAVWIVVSDTMHQGRVMYNFYKYEGADNIVDSFNLYDEFWDEKEHTYTYRDEIISEAEYNKIYNEIFGNE